MTKQSENAVLMWVVFKVPDKACVAKDLNMKELSFIQKYKQKKPPAVRYVTIIQFEIASFT